jgi:uncharacterized Fe-S cluster protein YjdI
MMTDEMAADGNEHEDASADAEWRRERRMRPGVEREYQGDGFVVTWEPHLCIHASECFRNLPGVFRPWDRPWVRVEQGSAEEIEAVVALCPDAALKFERTPPAPED